MSDMAQIGVIAAFRRVCQGVGLAALFAAPAIAAECPPKGMASGPVEVRLDTAIAEPAWRNDRSRRQLSELAGQDSGLKGFQHSGLTQSRTELRMTPSYRVVSYPNGRICVMLTGVQAVWRVTDLTVDIAREYPPGTCQHRVVHEHESEHVTIARAVYRAWVPKVEARLKEAARGIEPALVRDSEAEAQRMTARLMKSVQSELDAYQADLKARQAVIDTPGNYRAESAKCPSW